MGIKPNGEDNSSTGDDIRLKSGREGLMGWLNPTRYGWERVSYWLQRLTGVGLLIYFIGHIYETSSLVNGINAWNSMLELTQTTGGHIFLLLVIGASTFHTVNGLRLIFTESGIGIGRPGRPDYPYDATSLNYKQKSGIWVALLLATIAMLYGGMVMFGDVT
ncbi:putative succinate dehydrogenase/fumarate reductase [Candidatus Nitrosocosmicus arcticus]|uniref:Putative succinate dehydrogenase/fumarate reductase n=2 Tax=Candidatus Nitrosocosmicus arcticus TaxID=2035267 RepID=A0A557SW56_9ARCH|nr:succinate dehydrogenase [Candidatus Nitrosocosmicus arcticus]TVP40847.1 putative succinate dehydrogenase/fumarate reductase [Candidatus Nitrosocosmicus arcticus]